MISLQELIEIFNQYREGDFVGALQYEQKKHVEVIQDLLHENIDSGRFQSVQKLYHGGNLSEIQYAHIVTSHYIKNHDRIIALSQGNSLEWQNLWERLYRLAYHQLVKYGWDQETAQKRAEEVVQDSCLTIYHHRYPFDCSFDAWSAFIMLNTLKRSYLRTHNPLDVPGGITALSTIDDNGEGSDEWSKAQFIAQGESVETFRVLDDREQLFWAIQQLPSLAQRQVIVGMFFEGLSAADMAKQLGRTNQAVFNLKHQAMTKLHHLLASE